MRFATRSRASRATFSNLSLSTQSASERQRRANGAQTDECQLDACTFNVMSGTNKANKGESDETKLYVNHRVVAVDPLLYVSPGGRHCPRDGAGNAHKPHSGADLCPLAVRNIGTRGTSIRVHHYPPRGLFSFVVPLAHMRGNGVGVTSRLANSHRPFFFLLTIVA